MKHSKALLTPEWTHLLRFSMMLLGIGLFPATIAWASQIVVPAFPSERFSDAWIEGGLLVLQTEDGRLYSVPAGSIELESVPAVGTNTIPSVDDVIELLLAGVSERTIKAYIESSGVRFDISKDDILSLKRAGATEAFIQYLIFRGSAGPITNYLTWRGPSASRRQAPPATDVQEAGAQENVGGMAYFPYVFPGIGAYYPAYPGHAVCPIPPPYPARHGERSEGNQDRDLPPGASPGYYWPTTRSLMEPSMGATERPGRPTPEPHRQSAPGTGGLWLRWKGGSNPNRSSYETEGSRRSEPSSPSLRGAPAATRTFGPARTTRGASSSGRVGPASGGSGIGGSGGAGRSSGTRSIMKKN